MSVGSTYIPSVYITGTSSVCSNGYASFTATTMHASTPYYTWYAGSSVIGQGYSGTLNSQTITAISGSQLSSGPVTCVISNTGCNSGNATSNTLNVSITPQPTLTPSITTSPSTPYCGTSSAITWGTPINCSVNTTTGSITKTSSTFLWDASVTSTTALANGTFAEFTLTGSNASLGLVYSSPASPYYYNTDYAIVVG